MEQQIDQQPGPKSPRSRSVYLDGILKVSVSILTDFSHLLYLLQVYRKGSIFFGDAGPVDLKTQAQSAGHPDHYYRNHQ
ncbi:hypothetical protein D3C81_2113720 [compost metagenome]